MSAPNARELELARGCVTTVIKDLARMREAVDEISDTERAARAIPAWLGIGLDPIRGDITTLRRSPDAADHELAQKLEEARLGLLAWADAVIPLPLYEREGKPWCAAARMALGLVDYRDLDLTEVNEREVVVFILSTFGGLTERQIAAVVGIAQPNIHAHLVKANQRGFKLGGNHGLHVDHSRAAVEPVDPAEEAFDDASVAMQSPPDPHLWRRTSRGRWTPMEIAEAAVLADLAGRGNDVEAKGSVEVIGGAKKIKRSREVGLEHLVHPHDRGAKNESLPEVPNDD